MKGLEKKEGAKRQPVPPLPKFWLEWQDEELSEGCDEYGNIFQELREKKTSYIVSLNEKKYGIGFGAYSYKSFEDAWKQAHEERFQKFDLKWQSLRFQLREILAWYNMIDLKQVEVEIRIKKKEAA
jgi:hypothetical protein